LIEKVALQWKKILIALLIVIFGMLATYKIFFFLLNSINDHISRCHDESAPEYIGEKDRRLRECGEKD
jgi:hypothetical protein